MCVTYCEGLTDDDVHVYFVSVPFLFALSRNMSL